MLKDRIDNFIRKYSTFHIRGSKRNILIVSTPRSGSTWLAELLATNRRIKLVREPLNLRKPAVVSDLGISNWNDLQQDHNQARLIRYLQGFLTGSSSHVDHKREKPFSKTWHPLTDRAIFKVLHGAERSIPDSCAGLNADALLLIRHPVPVAMSRRSLPRLSSFMEPEFLNQLTSVQQAEVKRIFGADDHYERAVLDWCFQNKIPFELVKEGSLLLVTYEELTVSPEEVLKLITDRFELKYDRLMQAQIAKPSGSSGQSRQDSKALLDQVQADDSRRIELVSKWVGKITPEQEKRTMEILAIFGIDVYELGNFMPVDKYLLRSDE